jgi:hypothetical protein
MSNANKTLTNRRDFFVGTNDTITSIDVDVNKVGITSSFVQYKHENGESYMVLEEAVNVETSNFFTFGAGYKVLATITYSCKPCDRINGNMVDIKEIVENMGAGFFKVDGLNERARDNTDLSNRIIISTHDREVADAATATYLGQWKGNSTIGFHIDLDAPSAYSGFEALCEVLNQIGYNPNNAFTDEVLDKLRADIKAKAIAYVNQPHSELA